MTFPESLFADPKPDVMDLRGEPTPCEVCGCDASDYDCPCGKWCDPCHDQFCATAECWAWDFDDE